MRIFALLLISASLLGAQGLPPVPQRAQAGIPLFLQGLGLRDPFTGKPQKLWELEEKIEMTTKEIELLRLQIEKAKLWQQYIELTGGRLLEAEQIPPLESPAQKPSQAPPRPASSPRASPPPLKVLAVIYGERTQRAHVRIGPASIWVKPGDHLKGWEVVAVREDGVVVRRGGKTTFFPIRR